MFIPRLIFIVLILATALCTSGCATVMVEAAKKSMEDRVTSDQVTDTQIAAGVMSAMSEKDKGLLVDVSVDVWEQRVLLTGTVTDSRIRRDVALAATSDKRVRKVYDELQVVSKEEQERRKEAQKTHANTKKEGVGRVIDDFWIETKISAQLLAASGVTSVNYRWRCVRGVLYLIGRAASNQELGKVLTIIRTTEGVKQVKPFVEVKPPGS